MKNIYTVTFVNPELRSETYTVSISAKAPRCAVRNARRRLAKNGVSGLHASDCFRYKETGVRPDGVLKLGIVRFPLSWKF